MQTTRAKCTAFHLVVNGTAGEGLTLTVSERKLVTEEWVKVAAGRFVGCAGDQK